MKKSLIGLGIAFVLLTSAQQASADSWCNTRNKCRWWQNKYTANAVVGCIGFSIPLCYRHSGSCGTADAYCDWRNCLWGGGTAHATNSSSGCVATKYRTGQGVAGTPLPDAVAASNDTGSSRVQSFADFDDVLKTVTITLTDGSLSSTRGGMPERLTAYIFREDVTEGVVVEEPVRTPENTIWTGSIVLADGVVRTSGFRTEGIGVSTDREGMSVARLSGVQVTIPYAGSDADFENLVVQVVLDEVQLTK